MCGIAGIIDLTGRHPVPRTALQGMARALIHRGPDEDGFFEHPQVGLASRRLSIVGLFDGRQPFSSSGNFDKEVRAVGLRVQLLRGGKSAGGVVCEFG